MADLAPIHGTVLDRTQLVCYERRMAAIDQGIRKKLHFCVGDVCQWERLRAHYNAHAAQLFRGVSTAQRAKTQSSKPSSGKGTQPYGGGMGAGNI